MRRWVAAAALLGVLGCASRYADPLPAQAQQFLARTQDGWQVPLVRYPAAQGGASKPILILHGVSSNPRSVDLDGEHSLARWMASRGRQAWTVALRSSQPEAGWDRSFESLWRQDLPAAIAFVRQATGAPAVDVVGHSMGGLVLYAYLAEGGLGVSSGVTLGSPTQLNWGTRYQGLIDTALSVLGAHDIPVVSPSHLALPFQGRWDGDPAGLLLINPANTTPDSFRRLTAMGAADIPYAVGRHFVAMVKTGRFGSADGTINYRTDMARIHTPILVVAGKADRLAIVPGVKDGYRALGGPKQWLLLGVENGVEADYAHMDLVIGERAPNELWPRVLEFTNAAP